MSQPAVTKVYLDSRYSIDGSTFDLANAGLLLNPKSRCWLGEFSCVAAWDTIDETNNQIVVIERGLYRIIALPTGPHDLESLREALEDGLNEAGKPAFMGTYGVTKVSTGASGSTFRSFEVTNNAEDFELPQDDPNSTLSNILTFPTGGIASSSHKSGFVDIRRTHSIYIHCPGFGAYQSYGCRGSRSLLAKIPVLVGYGGLVHVQSSGSEHDCIDVGVNSLTTLTLQLRDAAGHELDLKGTSWSCTLIFER